jgi:FixJ family two-component response regulator
MPEESSLVVVVDDDNSMREAVRRLMRAVGLAVETFPSAEHFLGSASLFRTACLIADANLPGMSGLDLHRLLVARSFDIPTIIITAYPDEVLKTLALDTGVLSYLIKPFAQDDLLSCVRSAIGTRTS